MKKGKSYVLTTHRCFRNRLQDKLLSAKWSCPTQSQERRRRRSLRSIFRSSSGRRRSGSPGLRQVRGRSAGSEWAGGEGRLVEESRTIKIPFMMIRQLHTSTGLLSHSTIAIRLRSRHLRKNQIKLNRMQQNATKKALKCEIKKDPESR